MPEIPRLLSMEYPGTWDCLIPRKQLSQLTRALLNNFTASSPTTRRCEIPSYDYVCEDGHYTERFLRIRDYVDTITCEHPVSVGKTCAKVATRQYLTLGQSRDAQPIDPIVVYRKRDGGYIYPGDSSPRHYPDAERVELRTLGEVRAVMREQNHLDNEWAEMTRMAEDAHYGEARKARRAQLMLSLSTNFGRDFARVAMEIADRRRDGRRYEANNYVEVTEFDRSNREKQYDASTRWRGRHA